MLELYKLLQLLLLKLITYQLNVLSKVSNLRDFLFLSLSQLLIDILDILLHLFLGLKKTLAISLVLGEIVGSHIASIRLGVQITLVKGIFVTERRKYSHMKRRLLSDIGCLVSASLCQESIHFLGACHSSSDFNFDVNLNILWLVLIFHDGQSPRESFRLSVTRAKAILKIRITPTRCVSTIQIFIFSKKTHHCLRPRKERTRLYKLNDTVWNLMMLTWNFNGMWFKIALGLLRNQEFCQDSIFVLWKGKVFISYLVVVRELSELLNFVLLLNRLKVYVICDPHVLQSLQEESFL